MILLTETAFGTHADDRVALLKLDGTECDYGGYRRTPAGRWRREGTETVNETLLIWPRGQGPKLNLVGAIALYRGPRRYAIKWLFNDSGAGAMRIFDKVQISISPGNIRVPMEG